MWLAITIIVFMVLVIILSVEKPKPKIDIHIPIENNNPVWEESNDGLPVNKEADDTLLSKIERLKELNRTFETTDEPIILENIKSEMEALVRYCVMHEKLYPTSMFKLKNSENILYQIKERYNERLYLVVKKSVEKYKLKMSEQMSDSDRDFETENIFSQIQEFECFIEKTAKNYKDCLSSFAEFHNQVEDLYSGLTYNDLELSEAFAIVLEKGTFKNYIIDVATLICTNNLNRKNLDNILKKYWINIKDAKLDLMDLLLSYIKIVVNTHVITKKEKHNIEILKLYFKIKEGNFFKYRYNEIQSICQQQFERLYRDNNIDYSDELFTVELQSIFDLSYSQIDKFKHDEIKRALKEGANILNLNTTTIFKT